MDFKLIIKKLNNTLTDKEAIMFSEWYNESAEHETYFKKVASNYPNNLNDIELEKAWKTIESKIDGTPKNNPFWKYGIAASIALIMALSYYFVATKNANTTNNLLAKNNIKAGTDKAVLTLEDGSNIALEKDLPFTSAYLESNGKELVYNSILKEIKPDVQYNYLTVPLGGQFILKLSDGTKIWLNSESKIKYPVTFKEGKTREVELIYGEAYFDVSASTLNNDSKFIVKTKQQTIEVLGTEFDVKAYKDQHTIYTTLIEGKVSVSSNNINENLVPGEQSILDTQDNSLIKIKYEKTENLTAWKDGMFIFDKQPLHEIMTTLSRWYNISVTFKDAQKQTIKFSGVLNKGENIADLLNYFQKTGEVSFNVIDRTILIE